MRCFGGQSTKEIKGSSSMQKRRPLHLSLIKTISAINGRDQKSVDDAVFVARLTSDITIPGNHLAEILQVVRRQLRTLEGKFANETRAHLGCVQAQILEQVQDQTKQNVAEVFDFETYIDPTVVANETSHSGSHAEIA